MPCHAEQYNLFVVSSHPYKLSKASDARKRQIPLPKGYNWNDISYVIGGVYKKARFLDKKGYIITSGKKGEELKTQYNLEDGTWSFYHKGEKKPYDCGRCHTTGYEKSGHQDKLEGIIGTWKFPGVQCEACHGPGAKHSLTKRPEDIIVDKSSKACGACHYRGKLESIPSSKGFIRHHEQYNSLLSGGHKKLSCTQCHNPHAKAKFGIKKSCQSCHETVAMDYKESTMEKAGVSCVECHMPKAVKSATNKGKYIGDIRAHIININTSKKEKMFYKDKTNKPFSKNFITLDFACLGCHQGRDMDWANKMTDKGIHKLGKPQ